MLLLLLFATICLLCNDSGQIIHKHTCASVIKLYNMAEWQYCFEAGKIIAGLVKSNGSIKSADIALAVHTVWPMCGIIHCIEEHNNVVIVIFVVPALVS